jgi:glutaconate CoA-transferase subunit B
MADYNAMELMLCVAARLLEDGSTAAVGTGAPVAAAVLAQKTRAPNLLIVFEAGGVAPLMPCMPISVGDSRSFYRALMATSMNDIMETCQRGMMDYTFLSGAQIDPYGNLNSTVIGDYRKPKARLPGSGGANDLASFCWRILVMMLHQRRRYVEKLDFITTPGYLSGPGAREAAGLPAGSGPYRVISDLAVMSFDDESKRMQVESVHPGVSFAQIQENTGFEIHAAPGVKRTEPPEKEELRILREEIDPFRYIIGR